MATGAIGEQGADAAKALLTVQAGASPSPRPAGRAGHVDSDRIAEDAVAGAINGNVAAAGGKRHHQFNLVMNVLDSGG